MKTQRRFRPEFKRQVIEELLSGVSSPAQLIRRYEISSGLLYHWRKQYAKGAFENPPDQTAALEERVRQLEQLVGKLTLENEFLKKSCAEEPRTHSEKRQFLTQNRHLLQSIQRGGQLMSLPRSSYYYKGQEKKSDETSLAERIEELVEEFNGYGYRRITAQLHREGVRVNHKKVLRIMRMPPILGTLFPSRAEKIECQIRVSRPSRRYVSPLRLKLMFFWHQNYLHGAKKACHQWSSQIFKNS